MGVKLIYARLSVNSLGGASQPGGSLITWLTKASVSAPPISIAGGDIAHVKPEVISLVRADASRSCVVCLCAVYDNIYGEIFKGHTRCDFNYCVGVSPCCYLSLSLLLFFSLISLRFSLPFSRREIRGESSVTRITCRLALSYSGSGSFNPLAGSRLPRR